MSLEQIVKIQEDGKSIEVPINEGEMFLLPAKIPHSPIRPEGSIGLVIERKREKNHQDGLMWFCDQCNHKLYDTYFPLTNVEIDFLPRFKTFFTSKELRTCDNCGSEMETDQRFIN